MRDSRKCQNLNVLQILSSEPAANIYEYQHKIKKKFVLGLIVDCYGLQKD